MQQYQPQGIVRRQHQENKGNVRIELTGTYDVSATRSVEGMFRGNEKDQYFSPRKFLPLPKTKQK